jgi:dihydrofolate reductase
MKAIVIVDNNWGIGNGGKLLAHLPGDLAYFKKNTLNKIVVMGRKTLESLPGSKPLTDRYNFVLSHDPEYLEKHREQMKEFFQGNSSEAPKVDLAESIDVLQWKLQKFIEDKNKPKTIFVIGGASVYKQLMKFIDVCFVTKIDASFDADVYFPNLDTDPEFELVSAGKLNNENGFNYRFKKYQRVTSTEIKAQIGFL